METENQQSPIVEDDRVKWLSNGLMQGVVIVIIAIFLGQFVGGYFADDDQSIREVKSVSDGCYTAKDCEVFQHPLELPPGLVNPYAPTKGGIEAVDGHVPPSLSTDHDADSRQLKYYFYGANGAVADMVSQLDGVNKVTSISDGIVVKYAEGTDVLALRDQILTIIGHFG